MNYDACSISCRSCSAAQRSILFLTQEAGITSRFTLVVGYLASIPLVPFVRTIVKKTLIARDLWGVPTVVYGSGDTGHRVVDALKEEAGLGYRLVGMFDDDPEMWGDAYEDIPILGSTNQSISQAAVAILAMPHAPRQRIQEMLEGPLSHYRQVVIIPDLDRHADPLGEVPQSCRYHGARNRLPTAGPRRPIHEARRRSSVYDSVWLRSGCPCSGSLPLLSGLKIAIIRSFSRSG